MKGFGFIMPADGSGDVFVHQVGERCACLLCSMKASYSVRWRLTQRNTCFLFYLSRITSIRHCAVTSCLLSDGYPGWWIPQLSGRRRSRVLRRVGRTGSQESCQGDWTWWPGCSRCAFPPFDRLLWGVTQLIWIIHYTASSHFEQIKATVGSDKRCGPKLEW